jgi:hypothetical protein
MEGILSMTCPAYIAAIIGKTASGVHRVGALERALGFPTRQIAPRPNGIIVSATHRRE